MRLLGITLAPPLLTASTARADVFIPDDPPASDASCAAAAGDVIVIGRAQEGVIEVSVAGGPWLQLASGLIDACPKAAAAADGTVAIASAGWLYVRRGGTFAAPVKLGYDADDLAVAPGGWVVAAGLRLNPPRLALMATTIAPDGTARSSVLGRNRATRTHELETPLDPHAGIDAQGRATVAWSVARYGGTYDVRAATPGEAARVVARDVSYRILVQASQVDVAVTPAGHTLLVWADGKGIAATLDGAARQRLNREPLAGLPAAELADDGTGLIAYATPEAILTTDRAGTGPWVTHSLAHHPATGDEETPTVVQVWTSPAPDRRAAVAWGHPLTAANGRAGLAWTPAIAQSSITREGDSPSLTLTPGGEPRLVWVEYADDAPSRVRGSRLSAVGPADTTPPVLGATLPTRTPRTKTGEVTLRVPATCSETCDATVQLVGGRRIYASAVRELAASQQETLELRIDFFPGLLFVAGRRLRHPRLEVVVTDRAGNAARTSGTVAFRIADLPLLDYLAEPGHQFEMLTKAGNRAVARLVNRLFSGLARGAIKSERDLRRRFVRGRAAIRVKHAEIDDIEVREAIIGALYVPCKRRGFDPGYVVGG